MSTRASYSGGERTAALETLRRQGSDTASPWCLAENRRARRFYEKHGRQLNGGEPVAPFPPHPLDVGSIDLWADREG